MASRNLKRQATATSDLSDGWGDWEAEPHLKRRDVCDEPPAKKLRSDSEADCNGDRKRPLEFGDCCEEQPAKKWHSDADWQGGSGWHRSDSWSYDDSQNNSQPREWQDWNSWQHTADDYSGGKTAPPAPSDLMAECEDELRSEMQRRLSAAPSTPDIVEPFEPELSGAAAQKYEDIKEVMDLIQAGKKVPASHRVLQDMRRKSKRDPRYLNAHSTAAKQAFMQEFLQTSMDTIVEEHRHTQSHTEADHVGGEMESFDYIVTLEGGAQNPANVIAARNRCRECIRRGPRYFEYCTWSKRMRFSYVKRGFADTASKSWQQTTVGQKTRGSSSGPGQLAIKAPAPAGASPAANKSGGPPPSPNTLTPKSKSALDTAFQKATQMKTLYNQVESKASNLLESFSFPENKTEKRGYSKLITSALQAMRDAKNADPFFQSFVLKEAVDVKAAHRDDDLIRLCNRFVDKIKVPQEALASLNLQVTNVQRARIAAAKAKKPVKQPKAAPQRKAGTD